MASGIISSVTCVWRDAECKDIVHRDSSIPFELS